MLADRPSPPASVTRSLPEFGLLADPRDPTPTVPKHRVAGYEAPAETPAALSRNPRWRHRRRQDPSMPSRHSDQAQSGVAMSRLPARASHFADTAPPLSAAHPSDPAEPSVRIQARPGHDYRHALRHKTLQAPPARLHCEGRIRSRSLARQSPDPIRPAGT